MAKWFLANTVIVKLNPGGADTLNAGKVVDDAVLPAAAIRAAGGQLIPISDAMASTASALALQLSLQGQSVERLDSIMIAALAAEANLSTLSRQRSTKAAGQTVAAAGAIVPAISFTPTFSGKVLVRAWCSVQALQSAATFTPILQQGATTIAAPAQCTGVASDGNAWQVYVDVEVTGLALGAAVTFNFVTTGGDGTVTLGHGATGIAAAMEVIERP